MLPDRQTIGTTRQHGCRFFSGDLQGARHKPVPYRAYFIPGLTGALHGIGLQSFLVLCAWEQTTPARNTACVPGLPCCVVPAWALAWCSELLPILTIIFRVILSLMCTAFLTKKVFFMIRLFSISLMLALLAGCATQSSIEADINIRGIEQGEIAILETYKDNPYITTSKQAMPSYIDYSNAMESAIYNRNLDVVKYLTSINAANKVSVRFINSNNQWDRTPVNVSAAELACGVAAFDIMALLLESYPDDKVNYTNCLHYLVASYSYYPSGHFFILNNPAPNWRDGENTAIAVKKIIDLGGDPNGTPEYGIPMYEKVLTAATDNLLNTLLENGMKADVLYPCAGGNCDFLTDLSYYNDEKRASERARKLIEYGANINAINQVPVISGVDANGGFTYHQKTMSPLHMARFYGRDELAATLIELGADPTLANEDGKTPDSYSGQYAQLKTTQSQQTATNQQSVADQDRGGSAVGTIFSVLSAIGAGGL